MSGREAVRQDHASVSASHEHGCQWLPLSSPIAGVRRKAAGERGNGFGAFPGSQGWSRKSNYAAAGAFMNGRSRKYLRCRTEKLSAFDLLKHEAQCCNSLSPTTGDGYSLAAVWSGMPAFGLEAIVCTSGVTERLFDATVGI